MIARCGDDALAGDAIAEQDNGPVWAALGRAQRRAVGSARALRFTLSRDVAARTNLCTLAVYMDAYDERDLAAAMIQPGGHQAACHPTVPERTVFSSGRIHVTEVGQDGDIGRVRAYRACLDANRPRPVDQGLTVLGGSGGLSVDVRMFTAAGTWLAWTTLELDAESLTPLPKLKILDLAATPTAPTTVDAFATHVQEGHFLSLAVGSTGTLAWVLDQGHHDPAPDDPVELKARKPNGATVTLDHATNAALGHLAIVGGTVHEGSRDSLSARVGIQRRYAAQGMADG